MNSFSHKHINIGKTLPRLDCCYRLFRGTFHSTGSLRGRKLFPLLGSWLPAGALGIAVPVPSMPEAAPKHTGTPTHSHCCYLGSGTAYSERPPPRHGGVISWRWGQPPGGGGGDLNFPKKKMWAVRFAFFFSAFALSSKNATGRLITNKLTDLVTFYWNRNF